MSEENRRFEEETVVLLLAIFWQLGAGLSPYYRETGEFDFYVSHAVEPEVAKEFMETNALVRAVFGLRETERGRAALQEAVDRWRLQDLTASWRLLEGLGLPNDSAYGEAVRKMEQEFLKGLEDAQEEERSEE